MTQWCVIPNFFIVMNVEINHRMVDVPVGITNLEALLEQEGFRGKGQAVAVNNRVVPKAQWGETAIEEDMKITVIRAVCGG